MNWWIAVGIIVVTALLGGLYYWLVVITEGVYLGGWLVVWLYDFTAHSYDGIKQYDMGDERILVVEPILAEIGPGQKPLLLDVATGTGRVPQFLLQDGRFADDLDGRIIGLDPARKMLNYAVKNLEGTPPRVSWVEQTADALPFPAESFEGVTCLEALEFFPSMEDALLEMIRVLKPGGLLMVTRRTGWEAKTFVGRYYSKEAFQQLLFDEGMVDVMTFLWQNNYDLVLAHKPQQPRNKE